MTDTKISSMMIALLLVGLFATGYGIYISNIVTPYGKTYDNSSISIYQENLQLLSAKTRQIEGNVTSIKMQSGILDVLGGYMYSGYQTIVVSFSSIKLFDTMLGSLTESLNLPFGFGGHLFLVLGSIVIISLIFLILSAILKWRM